MESVFDVDSIVVSKSVKNTADDPDDATFASSWDNTRVLLHVVRSGSLDMPQWCRTIHWGGDGSSIGGVMETFGDDMHRSDFVRTRFDIQVKEVFPEAAQVITGVL